VIDLSERSPQPVAKIFPFRMPKNKELMFPERPPKIEIPNATDFTWHTKAGYQDLDTNEHVNNTRYIDWFYETLPLDFLRNHQLSQIEINYLAEAFYDQRIVVATQKVADNIFLHTVNELSSASSICRARSVWR
jgi:medium-chain acyl-[acyl-carrier-protein] hydrolase